MVLRPAIIQSGQDARHQLAMHVRQSEVSALIAVGQSFVVNSQQVQDGGVEVMNVNWIADNVDAVVIRFSVNGS